jgi:hypothetical protein
MELKSSSDIILFMADENDRESVKIDRVVSLELVEGWGEG